MLNDLDSALMLHLFKERKDSDLNKRVSKGKVISTKTLLAMKLTVILILSACLAAGARGYSQRVNLAVQNTPLEKVFSEIERQTGYYFAYTREALQLTSPVTIKIKNASVAEALDACLKNQPLTYTITDNVISVRRQEIEILKPLNEIPGIDVHGRVINEKGEGIVAATITIRGSTTATITDANGYFTLLGIADNSVLVVSAVNIEETVIRVNNRSEIEIKVKTRVITGSEARVNTGYQTFKPNEVTGSVVVITREQLDARVAPDILSKLEGITNGLVFNKDPFDGKSKLRIRGESTISANAEPLIVVDNFPYNGDIRNLNPNDVESITVLKDAAAASIWGVQAGNGVIVIVTRRGVMNQPLRVGLNVNTTIGNKPDLFYTPQISSNDYIDFETTLFGQGFYDGTLFNPFVAVSPVVNILDQRRQGLITPSDSASQINAFRNLDQRNDLRRYVYQKSIAQQYQVNLSGGGNRAAYYFSAGYDKGRSMEVGSNTNRITLSNSTTLRPLRKLELQLSLVYSESSSKDQSNEFASNSYPYQLLTDANGNPVAIPQRNAVFEDTVGNHGFPDWKYVPLREGKYIERNGLDQSVRLATSLKYSIIKGLDAEISYQFQRGANENTSLFTPESYFIRDKSNMFAMVDAEGNYIGSNFPSGGIREETKSKLVGHQGRASITYNNNWNKMHAVSALAGFEVRETKSELNSSRLLGFDKATGSFVFPDLFEDYPLYPSFSGFSNLYNIVGTGQGYAGSLNRFRSYFANLAYTFRERYTLSGSARFDGSNYFGVRTNQKTVPLWSIGGKWDINNESFYKLAFVPQLTLRVTYGYSGNLAPNLAAITTFQYLSNAQFTGLPYAGINNIPNPDLRWERSGQFNLGLGFGLKNDIISGNIEYFRKKGDDLIGPTFLDPTTGVTSFTGNFSGLKTTGWDIQLRSTNINRVLKWTTVLNFNQAKEIVTRYDPEGGALTFFAAYGTISPEVGKPLYGLYSYQWAGLDPATGGPRYYSSDTISSDYTNTTRSQLKRDDIVFSGKYNPPVTGAIMNTVTWKGLSFSFNIMFKLGHYFRRNSINYYQLSQNWRLGHSDFADRWQHPGDEAHTDVPSFIYPDFSFGNRDDFYQNSTVLIEKGDHARLQFINLGYNIPASFTRKISIASLHLFFYANNLGIIWRANDRKIDPDYPYLPPPPKTFSFGIQAGF